MSEAIDAFRALDTEPYGVNEAGAESHRAFIAQLNLPFDLLIDTNLAVSELYGCVRDGARMNKRTVIIVGKNGKVIYREAGSPDPEVLLEAISAADDAE